MGGSKLVQPQRFSVVLSNAIAIVVHEAQAVLRSVKVLCSSESIKHNRLDVIVRNESYTILIQSAEHELPVSAAQP